MFKKLGQLRSAFADYTLGTVIVVAHLVMADYIERRQPALPMLSR